MFIFCSSFFLRPFETGVDGTLGRAKFREHTVCLRRSICAALLTCFLFSSNNSSAGDFSLIYAIDANGKTDAGRIETCEYFKHMRDKIRRP